MICKKCNIDKSDSEFYKYNRRGSIKPYGICIECTKVKSKERYKLLIVRKGIKKKLVQMNFTYGYAITTHKSQGSE